MFGFLTRAELGDVDADELSTNGLLARFNFNLNVRIGNWFRWFRSKRPSFDISIGIQLFGFRYSNLKILTEFFYLKYLTTRMLFQPLDFSV